ncbi:MAG: TolC family protein, partial [Elusimicrobiota bacterium]
AAGAAREENGTGAAVRVSLPDAVSGALFRSPRLESLRKRGLQARESGRELSLRRLPSLGARFQATRGDGPVYSFGSLLQQRAFTAQDFALDRLNGPGYRTNFQSSLELGMPLFTGFELTEQAALAHLARAGAEEALDGASQALRYESLSLFLSALRAEGTARSLTERLLSSKMEAADASRLKDKGLVLGSDYYAAEAILASMEAWRQKVLGEAGAAAARLGVLLGRAEIAPAGTLNPGAYELQEEERSLSRALSERRDLRLALDTEEGARVQQRRAARTLLPRVEAFAAVQTDSGELSSAPSSRILGVRAGFPFGNPAYGARRAGARAGVESAEAEREDLADHVRADLLQARRGHLAAAASLPLAREAAGKARESLELFRPLYREGRQSVLDVLRAELALAQAEAAHLENLQALHASYAALRLAEGSLDDAAVAAIGRNLETRP